MTGWLFDTFLWTGALIAAVLLLRRPVARVFGPQVAYALWALPLVRLMLPPLVLPAGMAPVEAVPETGKAMVIVLAAGPGETAAASVDWFGIVTLALWLGGAAALLALRLRAYLAMRRDLLADARPMGEAGRVRLVETPAVSSPVAFGIRDKVIALPPGFMAQADLAARDMAIAHELAHHAGHDLLANLAAQPLLALHWFNPLAWWGWRAMRSDQEAACDARVVAGRDRSERAAYAEVIAGFAAGPRLALAAPMACAISGPVLGEKAIIHRLRSLTMKDVPSFRRKLGLAAIATTALAALPLTASISYAQPEAPEVPSAEEGATPEAPRRIVRTRIEHRADGEAADDREPRIERRRIIQRDGEEVAELEEAEIERMMAEIEADLEGLDEEIERSVADGMAAHRDMRLAMRDVPQVAMGCEDGDQVVTHRQLDDGRTMMIICQQAAMSQAQAGLRAAQRAIRQSRNLSPEVREEILRELETEIHDLEAERGEELSYAPAQGFAPVLRVRTMVTAPALVAAPMEPEASAVIIRASFVAPVVVPGDADAAPKRAI